ncbi:gliotoxin biosynthesis protein GliK [Seminavis robusta]|uniref:gamma-glutamylcyclotransferase n=1 Tax=Seminavis robusta TaxID=568900 RepID=A0A9N8E5L1_9STRA|nr:gliotoxin biosynthesis protein GliK [Seminavis robusta]|eukprot:Sro565_g167570.1 gliotoxin biosynthesis protein GliK (184) ;mRNA; f:18893-19444
MTALRRINCVESTAAVLPGYKLRFNIPGIPVVEPSWACVEECAKADDMVHGVLYTLTPQDFARVSLSEGVPWGYQWRVVDVVPYTGDGETAGQSAVAASDADSSSILQAYTLISNNPFLPRRDIPPSKGYRDLIIRGAREFQMDDEYIKKLLDTPVGFTVGEGFVAKDVLEAAEDRARRQNKR